MRDFRAGGDINVEGDVNIIDNSHQTKLLIQCGNEELFAERIHRQHLLGAERKAKWKRLASAWLVVAAVLSVISIILYVQGNSNLAGFVLGFGSLAVGLASVKVLEKPSEFETRQVAALNEIHMILRERGVES